MARHAGSILFQPSHSPRRPRFDAPQIPAARRCFSHNFEGGKILKAPLPRIDSRDTTATQQQPQSLTNKLQGWVGEQLLRRQCFAFAAKRVAETAAAAAAAAAAEAKKNGTPKSPTRETLIFFGAGEACSFGWRCPRRNEPYDAWRDAARQCQDDEGGSEVSHDSSSFLEVASEECSSSSSSSMRRNTKRNCPPSARIHLRWNHSHLYPSQRASVPQR